MSYHDGKHFSDAEENTALLLMLRPFVEVKQPWQDMVAKGCGGFWAVLAQKGIDLTNNYDACLMQSIKTGWGLQAVRDTVIPFSDFDKELNISDKLIRNKIT